MTERTRRSRWLVGLAGLGLVAVMGLPSVAQEPPPPIQVEQLTPRSTFTDQVHVKFRLKPADGGRTDVVQTGDPSRTVVARFTVQPGAMFPWHTHAGPVLVNVSQGTLVYVSSEDCVEQPFTAGTAFVDPGQGHVHTAFNPTDGVTILVATFLDAPASGPLSITEGVTPPEGCVVGGG